MPRRNEYERSPSGKTQKEAIYEAIEWAVGHTAAGHLSAVEELRRRAVMIYGKDTINRVTVVKHRSEWRREHGIEADARTHRDVPRRNMLKDDYASLALVEELDKFIKDNRAANRLTANRFHQFLSRAETKGLHSFEQLKIVSSHLDEFRREHRQAA
jgi:hypothetical protein